MRKFIFEKAESSDKIYSKMKERRSYIRFNISGEIRLEAEGERPLAVMAELFDICFIGVGIYAREKIEQGTPVKFTMTTSLSDERVSGKGKIAYSGETVKNGANIFRMGIDFSEVDKHAIQHILNLAQKSSLLDPKYKRAV